MNMDFFEKPGCINGEKQKNILQQAGHSLKCINILTYHWTREELLPFIEGKEPVGMMNYTAPAVKNGAIDPSRLSFDEAVNVMIESPILIKRPLIRVGGLYIQGFTDVRLKPFLGEWDGGEDVTTCPNLKSISCDERKSESNSK